MRRYWTSPEPASAGSRENERDAIERFRLAMEEAVKDRLRCSRIATTLSGGVDSTLVTGLAKHLAPPGTRIDAYSMGSDWLLPDQERYWAHLCAHHLGVSFHSVSLEDSLFNPPGNSCWRRASEPRFEMRVVFDALLRRVVADGGRVALSGIGGDVIVNGGAAHWRDKLASGKALSLLPEAWRYVTHFRRPPPLRTIWRKSRPNQSVPKYVAPLDSSFAAELELEERWQEVNRWLTVLDPRLGMAQHRDFWAELFSATIQSRCGYPSRSASFFDVRLLGEAMRLPTDALAVARQCRGDRRTGPSRDNHAPQDTAAGNAAMGGRATRLRTLAV